MVFKDQYFKSNLNLLMGKTSCVYTVFKLTNLQIQSIKANIYLI